MKKRIKIAAILLIISLVLLSFAACKGNNSDNKTSDTSSSQSNLAQNINDIFKSGTYQMSISTELEYEGTTQNMDMTVAVKNKEMAGKMSASGFEVRFVLKDNKYYMIYDTQKMIMSMEADSSLIEMPDFSNFSSQDFTLANKSNVTIDGKNLTCEEYKLADGSVKYYFDGSTLVKIETISGSTTYTMNVKEIKDTVDENLFEIPSDYEEISM